MIVLFIKINHIINLYVNLMVNLLTIQPLRLILLLHHVLVIEMKYIKVLFLSITECRETMAISFLSKLSKHF